MVAGVTNMRNRFLPALACVLALVSVVNARRAEHSLFVTVLDKSGAPLRDLKATDFVVLEDGQERTITAATLASEPLDVAIVLDTAKSGKEFPMREVREGLTAITSAVLAEHPQSRVSFAEYAGGGIKTLDFTSDGAKVTKAIERTVESQRATSMIVDRLIETGKDMQKSKAPRRAIVIISLGSPDAGQTQPAEAVAPVQKSGASVWAVSVGITPAMAEPLVENLPKMTGGKRTAMVGPSGLVAAMTRIGQSLTSQYQVTFTAGDTLSKNVQAGARRGDEVLRSMIIR